MDQLKPNKANTSPLTPIGFLDRAATVYGACISIAYNSTTYTWSQTHRRCLQLASSLSSIGVKRGDIVSIVAPNIPAMYEVHFAVPMAGAILNTINTRLDARTISVLLRHSQSKLVFVDREFQSVVLEAISLFPPESRSSSPTLVLINDDNDSITPSPKFIDTYEGLVAKGDPGFQWIRPETEWDPIVLNYTSGTTSAPKGVVHCHRGIFSVTLASLIDWSVPRHPVYLWTLPMFHVNGWSFPWGMAAVGGTNICVRKFDGPKIYDLIEKHNVTHMCGAPVVLNMLTNSKTQLLKHPVHVITAGAPPPATILLRVESLGFIVTHGYGLTEVGAVVVSCAWKKEWNRFPATERARLKARQGVSTIGTTEADVVNPETGVRVKRDGLTLGEVVLRGACVMLGYLKDESGTAKCLKEDGWFYTGDLAVMHPDGYFEIKDRSKDIIISGGENLSSVEIESAIYTYPPVNEVAVVACPDKFWGETPCAFVSLKAEIEIKPSEKEIIEYCREKLPHYMVPKKVVFKDELPKTSTGKIQKTVLREIAKGLGTIKTSRL